MTGTPSSERFQSPRSPYKGQRRPDLMSAGTTGMLVDSSLKPSEQFEAGRVCNEPGCTTVLSIYNSSDKCAAHPNTVVRLNSINGGGGFDHVLLKNRIKSRPGTDDGFARK